MNEGSQFEEDLWRAMMRGADPESALHHARQEQNDRRATYERHRYAQQHTRWLRYDLKRQSREPVAYDLFTLEDLTA